MPVSGHRNERSIKSYSKTDENTHKKEHGGQRKALIENEVSVIQKVVAYEAGKNVRNEELGWLTNSKEEFIFKRLERLN